MSPRLVKEHSVAVTNPKRNGRGPVRRMAATLVPSPTPARATRMRKREAATRSAPTFRPSIREAQAMPPSELMIAMSRNPSTNKGTDF